MHKCCRLLTARTYALLKPADGLKVTWDQTVDEVVIKVPVPSDTRGRDISFEVHPTRLNLSLKQQTLLKGSLVDAGPINSDDCFWTLESTDDGQKQAVVTLIKQTSGYKSWEQLLETDLVDMTITDRAFLQIKAGDQDIGKIAIGLFGNVVPRTVANFKALCAGSSDVSGSDGKALSFQDSPFHRIIPGFMAQGGDITLGDGTGGMSIYGESFEDENFKITHDQAGYVAMANAGPDTNNSQFYIIFKPQPHLNGKHVVFGKVEAGMDVLRKMEALGSPSGATSQPVKLVATGLLQGAAEVDAILKENAALATAQ